MKVSFVVLCCLAAAAVFTGERAAACKRHRLRDSHAISRAARARASARMRRVPRSAAPAATARARTHAAPAATRRHCRAAQHRALGNHARPPCASGGLHWAALWQYPGGYARYHQHPAGPATSRCYMRCYLRRAPQPPSKCACAPHATMPGTTHLPRPLKIPRSRSTTHSPDADPSRRAAGAGGH